MARDTARCEIAARDRPEPACPRTNDSGFLASLFYDRDRAAAEFAAAHGRTAEEIMTREVVTAIPAAAWTEMVGAADVARAVTAGAFGPNAGWVEKLGSGTTGFVPGQPVIVYGPWGCGLCMNCRPNR